MTFRLVRDLSNAEEASPYLDEGFVLSVRGLTPIVTLDVDDGREALSCANVSFKKPWLIQRCKINKPMKNFKEKMLSQALEFDYMGSAEFEFGAIPRALASLRLVHSCCTLKHLPIINKGGDALSMWGLFDSPDQAAQYAGFIADLLKGNLRLKERTMLEPHHWGHGNHGFDVWFDIENLVIFSFHKIFMKSRLEGHLQASYAHMDKLIQERGSK